MDKVHVIFGSTTGMTEMIANRLAADLGTTAINVGTADSSAFDAEVLVLGTSTWGLGDLQDDWMTKLDSVKTTFAGKKVAVFGLGDNMGFADTFCAAADTLATTAKEVGATLIGEVCRLDETNESDQTDARLAAFEGVIKAAL